MLKFETHNYAQALLELVKEDQVLEQELEKARKIRAILKKEVIILQIFTSVFVSKEEKFALFQKLFPDSGKHLVSLFWILVKKNATFKFNFILKEFINLVLKALDIIEGKVFSAVKLKKDEILQLEAIFSNKFGKKIVLYNIVDLNLLAGVRIVVANNIFELSFSSLLEQAKEIFLLKNREN